jgi:hypothetical protein
LADASLKADKGPCSAGVFCSFAEIARIPAFPTGVLTNFTNRNVEIETARKAELAG